MLHASVRLCGVSRKAPRFAGGGKARRFRGAVARYPCGFAARRDCANGGVGDRRRRKSGLREEKVVRSFPRFGAQERGNEPGKPHARNEKTPWNPTRNMI